MIKFSTLWQKIATFPTTVQVNRFDFYQLALLYFHCNTTTVLSFTIIWNHPNTNGRETS